MINVDNKEDLAKEAVAAGAQIIGVHTGLDAQAAGATPFEDLASIAALNTGAKISVAGGVKAATAQQVKDAGAAIIVAGAAIYGAADPAASAAEITAIAH
jgi:3-hexulose-6-phosphate synthase